MKGNHTIGIAHCASFIDHIYYTHDNTLNKSFIKHVYHVYPTKTSSNATILGICLPNMFDNKYYIDLINHLGLLTSN